MKVVLAAVSTAALFASVAAAEVKGFKDWLAGCDNGKACTALGIPRQDGDPIGYVKVEREAGPNAPVRASVIVLSESSEGDYTISVSIDGKPFGKGAYAATTDYSHTRAALNEADSAAFVAALVNAKTLTLQWREGGHAGEAINVSLDGSSAALRFIDAEQKRDGGVTALVAKGEKPASAVPPAPAYPVVAAKPMKALDPAPTPPRDLPTATDEGCLQTELAPIAFDLGGGRTLWGVCVMTGAYNFTYEFYLAGAGKIAKAPLVAPGSEPIEGLESAFTNPYVSEDGLVLSAFAKGRGIGDCGDAQDWAWDGTKMQPLSYQIMTECRGVAPDDWITLYRAKRQ